LFHQLAPERPDLPGTAKKRLSELEIISMKKARYWICLEWFEVDSDTGAGPSPR